MRAFLRVSLILLILCGLLGSTGVFAQNQILTPSTTRVTAPTTVPDQTEAQKTCAGENFQVTLGGYWEEGFERALLGVLQENPQIASVKIIIGGTDFFVQPLGPVSETQIKMTDIENAQVCALSDIRGIGSAQSGYGALWTMLKDNGYSNQEVQRGIGTFENLLYEAGNSEFIVTKAGNLMTFKVVSNEFYPKEELVPRDVVSYYAFDINTPAKQMQFALGEVPIYNTNTLTGSADLTCIGTRGLANACASDYYTNLSKLEMKFIFENLFSLRQIQGEDVVVQNGNTFHFLLQRYTERKWITAVMDDVEDGIAYKLTLTISDKTNVTPEIWDVIKFLNPNCKSNDEFWTGTCGASIPYCQKGECTFQSGVELVRQDLQDSNVATTNSLKELIRGWINFFLGFLFILAVVSIIVAGIMMVVNFGNDDMIGKAKNIIIYSIVGVLVIVFAYPIVNTLINAVQ